MRIALKLALIDFFYCSVKGSMSWLCIFFIRHRWRKKKTKDRFLEVNYPKTCLQLHEMRRKKWLFFYRKVLPALFNLTLLFFCVVCLIFLSLSIYWHVFIQVICLRCNHYVAWSYLRKIFKIKFVWLRNFFVCFWELQASRGNFEIVKCIFAENFSVWRF